MERGFTISLGSPFHSWGKYFSLSSGETGSRPCLQLSHAHSWTPMDPVDLDLNLSSYSAWPWTFIVIMDLPKHHWVLPDPGNSHQDDSDPGYLTLRKHPAAVVLSHFRCVPPHAVQVAVVFPCFQSAAGSSSVFCLWRLPDPFLQNCSPPSIPNSYHCKEFFLPGCRNLHLSMLNFTKFLFLISPVCLGPSAYIISVCHQLQTWHGLYFIASSKLLIKRLTMKDLKIRLLCYPIYQPESWVNPH